MVRLSVSKHLYTVIDLTLLSILKCTPEKCRAPLWIYQHLTIHKGCSIMDLLMTYSMVLTRHINRHALINLFFLSHSVSYWVSKRRVKEMLHLPGLQDDNISYLLCNYRLLWLYQILKKKNMNYEKWGPLTGLIEEWSSSLCYSQVAWILFILDLTWHTGIRVTHIMYNACNILEPVAHCTLCLTKTRNGAQNSVMNIVFLLSSDLRE